METDSTTPLDAVAAPTTTASTLITAASTTDTVNKRLHACRTGVGTGVASSCSNAELGNE